MSELFLKIVNMSISASWIVVAVLALRFCLKKAPKWVNVLLWGIVAARMAFPIFVFWTMTCNKIIKIKEMAKIINCTFVRLTGPKS